MQFQWLPGNSDIDSKVIVSIRNSCELDFSFFLIFVSPDHEDAA